MTEHFIDISNTLRFELNRANVTALEINPNVRLLNIDELDDHVKEYLRSLHTIQWMDWIITSEDGMEAASKFVQKLFDNIYAYAAKANATGTN